MPTYPGGGSARRNDPSTSHGAAQQNFTHLEIAVARTVRRFGPPKGLRLCVVEIWHLMPEHSIDSISPRMKKLVDKGLLWEHPKEPRANRYGKMRNQLVYSYRHKPRAVP